MGLLERFPGYTLSSLMEEDTELMRLVAIEDLGGGRDRREGVDDD